jgi:hypothetical protein
MDPCLTPWRRATGTVVSKNTCTGLRLQSRLNPLLAHLLKDPAPACSAFGDALMQPQTIRFGHGTPLLYPLEKHTLGPFNSLQLRVLPEAWPFPERFWTTMRPALSILISILNPVLPTIGFNHLPFSMAEQVPPSSPLPSNSRRRRTARARRAESGERRAESGERRQEYSYRDITSK